MSTEGRARGEQLALDLPGVQHKVGPLRPATVLLGTAGIAECRAILVAAVSRHSGGG